MGLDGVELVMEVEDRFRVKLPDGECSTVRTVADLAALVISQLPRATGICPTARAFFEVRKAIIAESRLERRTLRPDAMLASVFPRNGRRARWKQIERRVPLVPALVATESARRSIAAIGVALLGLWVVSSILMLVQLGMLGFAVSVGILFAGIAMFIRAKLFFATEFPSGCTTLGDLARKISPQSLPFAAGERLLAEQRILDQVQAITAEQFGLPRDQVKPESRFVEDLGMG
jgi:acyl carrier protein